MAVNFGKPFVEGSLVTTSTTPVFTGSSSVVRHVVSYARVTNYSASPVDFTVYVIPSGGSVADRYLALDERSIAAQDTELIAEIIGQPIEPSDTIQVKGSADTALTFSCGGTNITSE
jgi:hypothetical protein